MDPGTALQVAGMVCGASKALYQYFKTVKGYEKDVTKIQEQLTWLYNLFKSVESSLRLESVSKDNGKLLEDALLRCGRDALQLSSLAERAHPSADKPKGRARKFLYPFREPKIKEVLEQVRVCQNQLAFAVNFLQIDVTQQSQALLEQTHEKIDQANDNINKTNDNIQRTKDHISLTNDKIDNVERTLCSIDEKRKAQRIIDSLRNERFQERRLTVENAHAKTFEWILNEHISCGLELETGSDKVDDGQRDTNASDRSPSDSRFTAWSKEDGDVFWIRGKAGSGKSTLMKFLLDSQRTRRLLKQWAGPRTLIVAEHFFWIAGGIQQKSKHGMLQNVLYQILEASPQLVPEVCSRRWDSEVDAASKWATSELLDTLHRVAHTSGVRVCFFIDGLDESDPEIEHRSLVDDVFRLASYHNFKFVVSSRPWPAFDCCLDCKDTILALEDLTRRDMFLYVVDKVVAHSCGQLPEEMDWSYVYFTDRRHAQSLRYEHRPAWSLVCNILDKADGVFLWVSIVVRNICQQLLARRPLSALTKYIYALPPTLEEYFLLQILERVQDTSVADNAMILKFMAMHGDHHGYQAFDICWILSQKGTDFFNDQLFYLQHSSSLPVAPLETMEETVKAFISVCCKDFFSVKKSDPIADPYPLIKVCPYPWIEVLHRTVFDFLNTQEIQAIINSHVPDYFCAKHIFEKFQILSTKLELARSNAKLDIPGGLMNSLKDLLRGPHPYILYGDARCMDMESWPSQIVKESGSLLLDCLRQGVWSDGCI